MRTQQQVLRELEEQERLIAEYRDSIARTWTDAPAWMAAYAAAFAALLAVASYVSFAIPLTDVPFTLQVLIVLLAGFVLGPGLGALSVVLYVVRQSNRITVKRRVIDPSSQWPTEQDPPAEVPPGEVVVLQPYGSLFFAAAPVFEAQRPDVTDGAHGSVVIIRLRGKEDIGSTFISVVTRYSGQLR